MKNAKRTSENKNEDTVPTGEHDYAKNGSLFVIEYVNKKADERYLYSKFEDRNLRGYKNLEKFKDIVKQFSQEMMGYDVPLRPKKNYVLSYVLFHVFCQIFSDSRNPNCQWTLLHDWNWMEIPATKNDYKWALQLRWGNLLQLEENGYGFRFSFSHDSQLERHFLDESFSHSSIRTVIKELRDLGYFLHRRGYTIPRKNSLTGEKEWRLGLLFQNLHKFLTFYDKYRDFFEDFFSHRKFKDDTPLIEIRSTKHLRQKGVEIANIDNEENDDDEENNKEDISDGDSKKKKDEKPKKILFPASPSHDFTDAKGVTRNFKDWKVITRYRAYVKQLRNFYSTFSVSLGQLSDLSPELQESIRKDCLNYPQSLNLESLEFDEDWYSRFVTTKKRFLGHPQKSPKAVFHYHYDVDKLVWGRVYGNKGVDSLQTIMTPLLKIDGEYCSEIDSKSSSVQIFYLMNTKGSKGWRNINTRIDFYSHPEVQERYNLTRADMKKLYQYLMNNPKCESGFLKAFRAFNNYLTNEHRDNFKKKVFDALVESLMKDRRHIDKLFGNPTYVKEVILEESMLFKEVISECMKRNIPCIYHFDSVFVKESDTERVLKIFDTVSKKRYGNLLHTNVGS